MRSPSDGELEYMHSLCACVEYVIIFTTQRFGLLIYELLYSVSLSLKIICLKLNFIHFLQQNVAKLGRSDITEYKTKRI